MKSEIISIETAKHIKNLEDKINKVEKYIIEKYSNEDGTIWNSDIKKILEILKGE